MAWHGAAIVAGSAGRTTRLHQFIQHNRLQHSLFLWPQLFECACFTQLTTEIPSCIVCAPVNGASLAPCDLLKVSQSAQLPTVSGHMSPLESWEDPGGEVFMVRGLDYPKSKKKVASGPAFYK